MSTETSFRWAIAALERMDLVGFLGACRELASVPGAELYRYELVRSATELLGRHIGVDPAEARWRTISELVGEVDHSASAFLTQIERLVEPFLRSRTPVNPMVARALRYVEEHVDQPLSLSKIAREVGLARNYMSSLFHRETGVTMTEYIHQVRIRRAVQLLQAGGHSMNEVARMVGYGSYRHFHRRFSRLHSVPPTAWRREDGSLATEPVH